MDTRAVLRRIEAGNQGACPHCDEPVKFVSRSVPAIRTQVICNVYEDGKWSRVEVWHYLCYVEAGMPHGEVGSPQDAPGRASGFTRRKSA